MQILLVQLSDIHIRSSEDEVLARGEAIKLACHGFAPNASACIIVLSGDIAFSGSVQQYEAAHKFLIDLEERIRSLPSISDVSFIAVPGNHDCDFTAESDIRGFMLRDIQALYESSIAPGSDGATAILEVQRNFFAFEARISRSKEIGFGQRLNYEKQIKYGNFTIGFHCYNTAWLAYPFGFGMGGPLFSLLNFRT
jgi:hypothetical protein